MAENFIFTSLVDAYIPNNGVTALVPRHRYLVRRSEFRIVAHIHLVESTFGYRQFDLTINIWSQCLIGNC